MGNNKISLKRLYGYPIDFSKEIVMKLINSYASLRLNQRLEKMTHFSNKMKLNEFYAKNFKSDKIPILWNSSIEDSLLKKNYEYSINFKKKEIKFSNFENQTRWNSVYRKVTELKLLTSNDYLVDLGCSTGFFVNGFALLTSCRTVGIDINVDGCLEYAKKFEVKNAKFKQMSVQDLFKVLFDRKFKIVLFTYQSHGDSRWLTNKNLHIKFFNWLKKNAEYVIMEDPGNKMPLPDNSWFVEHTTIKDGGFSKKYPLKIYRIIN